MEGGFFDRSSSGRPHQDPETPQTLLTLSPFSDFEFGLLPQKNSISGPNKAEFGARVGTEGYPSPPASISSNDPGVVPPPSVNPDTANARPSSSRRNQPQPSGLRRINTLDDADSPPTPERTVSQASEDQTAHSSTSSAKSVVRNVRVRRDTMAFHQPRQVSMAMDVDTFQERKWERDASPTGTPSKAQPLVEGFDGNFAAFDFGESVAKGGSVDMGLQNHQQDDKRRSTHTWNDDKGSTTQTTYDDKRSTTYDDKRSTVHTMRTVSNFSGHPSLDTMGSALGALWPSPPTDETEGLGIPGDTRSYASLGKKEESPLQDPRPPPVNLDSPIIPPDNFRSRDPFPQRPHTSAGPKLTPSAPPLAALGAYRPPGSSHGETHEGPFTGLEPPRGFMGRPRVGSASGPSTRSPPKPLQLRPLADRSDTTPRNSPYGPPPDEGNYVRSEGSGRRLHDGTASPYGPPPEEGNYVRAEGDLRRPPEPPAATSSAGAARSTPIEGDFPVSKGLPRGRRPTFTAPTSSEQAPILDDFDAPAPPKYFARQSAMPAPLSPFRTTTTITATNSSNTLNEKPRSPHRPLRSDEWFPPNTPTTLSGAPQLDLEGSETGDDFAKSLEGVLEGIKPLISPVLMSGSAPLGSGRSENMRSPMRMEFEKAPPRPAPSPSAVPAGRGDFTAPYI